MTEHRTHFAGDRHVPPDTGSKGYDRVVSRGCAGGTDDSVDADCKHGYTWACEECPVLRARWAAEDAAP